MRSASEILGEYACDEWTAREWKQAHDAVECGMLEAEANGFRKGIEDAAQLLCERLAEGVSPQTALALNFIPYRIRALLKTLEAGE